MRCPPASSTLSIPLLSGVGGLNDPKWGTFPQRQYDVHRATATATAAGGRHSVYNLVGTIRSRFTEFLPNRSEEQTAHATTRRYRWNEGRGKRPYWSDSFPK